VPAETHETNPAFDAQARGFESLGGLGHARTRAH
jgi:hypothetical protein